MAALSAHPNPLTRLPLHFLAIVAGPGAVDDEEVAFVEDEQEVVPHALQIVDALVTGGAKKPDSGGIEATGRRDRDQIGAAAQRDEGLAAEGMPLERLEHELGKGAGPE